MTYRYRTISDALLEVIPVETGVSAIRLRGLDRCADSVNARLLFYKYIMEHYPIYRDKIGTTLYRHSATLCCYAKMLEDRRGDQGFIRLYRKVEWAMAQKMYAEPPVAVGGGRLPFSMALRHLQGHCSPTHANFFERQAAVDKEAVITEYGETVKVEFVSKWGDDFVMECPFDEDEVINPEIYEYE